MRVATKLSYAARWLPGLLLQNILRRQPEGNAHLIFALADHFEPAIVPGCGKARAKIDEQECRLERWCRDYPQSAGDWRDSEGYPFRHTYFYPAEQYHKGLIDRLAEHCEAGWGEIEIHLHHGMDAPDTAENTRRQLIDFRDTLAMEHGCLSYANDSSIPRYAFVHGNFALANSAGGADCGVDSEVQVLADTGCYADLTLPAAVGHPAQISKTNSLYECALPLHRKAAHRRGRSLVRGNPVTSFPLIVQGPLLLDFRTQSHFRRLGIENGALTRPNPPSLHRLRLWKHAGIHVGGRRDWLFIKLHCHSMDPTQTDALAGPLMGNFLRELVEGAGARREILHFVTAREMVNVILAACDGREGNPSAYRDYRFQRYRAGQRVAPRAVAHGTAKG